MDDADSTPWGAIEKDNTVKAEAPKAGPAHRRRG